MPYQIQNTAEALILELQGGITVRDAGELVKCLASVLTSGANVVVRTQRLEDVDTSILQMLVSLRKTAGTFVVQDPSEVFVNAVDRCALRPELLGVQKDAL